jgi:hypothetical protein
MLGSKSSDQGASQVFQQPLLSDSERGMDNDSDTDSIAAM